jgi:hypothetical protein
VYILSAGIDEMLDRSWQHSNTPYILYAIIIGVLYGLMIPDSNSPHIGTYKMGILSGVLAGSYIMS